MSALLVKALAVLASGSWAPVPSPDPAPVRDPLRHHHHRPKPDPAPTRTALASWYGEHGVGACGLGPDVQSGYRFASLILRCGTRIRVCHRGCVVATMADHGPYVAGRTFDLNVNLRDAIGCGDLCSVRWALR